MDTAIYHPILPRTFRRFRENFPAVRLDLLQQTSAVQGELLRANELDLALVFHHPPHLSTLAHRPIATDPIVLAVPVSHPLARRRTARLRDLQHEPFVWIPRSVSPPFYDAIFAACARHDFAPRIVQEGTTDLTNLSLVAAGAGLTFTVASAARRKPDATVLLRLTDLRLTVRLDAVWRTDHPHPALSHFLSLLPALRAQEDPLG